ncbi:MAG: DNA polymerase III subunit beta [Opitutales bacterium]|nr:DNA polymerase III subunit beta [Opitutales bacterium]MCH8540174.1 DNA polymerase III subunit beta [Opitutales bacterium]
MKITINRDNFSSGLQQVLNLVPTKPQMPILGNVLIVTEDDGIALTTTNLDLGIRCRIKAEVSEPGQITLPVRRLANIVRELPHSEVSFETDDDHQAKLRSGGSSFKVMGIGEEEFPALSTLESEQTVVLPQLELADMLRSVSYAQSADESRFILNGVYFKLSDQKLTVVATDGRRLAVHSKEIEQGGEKEGSFILPAKTVAELLRQLNRDDNITITFTERQAAFEIGVGKESGGLLGNVYMVSKIVEGSYPNYQQVIPKETHQRIKLERELLLQCIHRAALVTSEKSNTVKMEISPNHLEISARSAEFGEAHESIAIQYDGPKIAAAFNPVFLMDPLKALPQDDVFFEIKDDLSPGVFKTLDDFLCVVMPLRLN